MFNLAVFALSCLSLRLHSTHSHTVNVYDDVGDDEHGNDNDDDGGGGWQWWRPLHSSTFCVLAHQTTPIYDANVNFNVNALANVHRHTHRERKKKDESS